MTGRATRAALCRAQCAAARVGTLHEVAWTVDGVDERKIRARAAQLPGEHRRGGRLISLAAAHVDKTTCGSPTGDPAYRIKQDHGMNRNTAMERLRLDTPG